MLNKTFLRGYIKRRPVWFNDPVTCNKMPASAVKDRRSSVTTITGKITIDMEHYFYLPIQ